MARLHKTSGGESETELNELAVMPTNWPDGARAVITVTPVANWPSASRNARVSKFGGAARFINEQISIFVLRHARGMLGLDGRRVNNLKTNDK